MPRASSGTQVNILGEGILNNKHVPVAKTCNAELKYVSCTLLEWFSSDKCVHWSSLMRCGTPSGITWNTLFAPQLDVTWHEWPVTQSRHMFQDFICRQMTWITGFPCSSCRTVSLKAWGTTWSDTDFVGGFKTLRQSKLLWKVSLWYSFSAGVRFFRSQ